MIYKSEVLTINKREYTSQLEFTSSRIRQDKKIELDMKQEYYGRELYEMIQNADDEGSPQVELLLTEDNHLHIKNWGKKTIYKRWYVVYYAFLYIYKDRYCIQGFCY